MVLVPFISGIKLFECDICKQKFSSNVALTEHTARHTDSKPHKCEECGRMFRQVGSFDTLNEIIETVCSNETLETSCTRLLL